MICVVVGCIGSVGASDDGNVSQEDKNGSVNSALDDDELQDNKTDPASSNTTTTENTPIVEEKPTASFTITKDGLTITLTDTSTSGVTAWAWDFDDGSSGSTDPNPTHTYTVAGTYDVSLTVTKNGVTSEKYTHRITVEGDSSSVTEYKVAIIASVQNGTNPLKVDFSLNLTFPSSEITKVTWDFDDGNDAFSSSHTPTYTFEDSGTYDVSVEVVHSTQGTLTNKTAIKVTEYEDLTSSFTTNVTSGKAPLTVMFNDTSKGSPTSWTWDFDEGSSARKTTQHAIYTFEDTGSYTVTLTVGNGTSTASVNKTITVTSTTATSTTTRTTSATTVPTTAQPTTEIAVMSAEPELASNPVSVVNELFRLFFAMFNPSNYSMIFGDIQ